MLILIREYKRVERDLCGCEGCNLRGRKIRGAALDPINMIPVEDVGENKKHHSGARGILQVTTVSYKQKPTCDCICEQHTVLGFNSSVTYSI